MNLKKISLSTLFTKNSIFIYMIKLNDSYLLRINDSYDEYDLKIKYCSFCNKKLK